jgi:hypothetical protein
MKLVYPFQFSPVLKDLLCNRPFPHEDECCRSYSGFSQAVPSAPDHDEGGNYNNCGEA